MQVWVVGSLGMLGSAVYKRLQEENIPCVSSDRREVNITSLEEIDAFAENHAFTHIINCAAYTKVDNAEKEQELAQLVNVEGPKNLATLAKRIGAHLVHFSTDYVFDGSSKAPYQETDSCKPCNAYGLTKREGEEKVIEILPTACIIRSSWLFGLNGNNFIIKMLQQMQQKDEVSVVADQHGRPTFCEDLAEAVIVLMNCSGIFHYANTDETTWYELTQCIYHEAKALGFQLKTRSIHPVTTDQFPTPAKRPQYSVLDTQKIELLMGKKPRPWKDAVREYLHEYFQSLCQ